jgi:TonB family protein
VGNAPNLQASTAKGGVGVTKPVSTLLISKPAMTPPRGAEIAMSSQLAQKPKAASAAATLRIADQRDLAVFTYKPTPTDSPEMRKLSAPGLARVVFNDQGKATNVTLLQSTGDRRSDAEAIDTLRQWRIQAGAAREIELPLTTVMSGKRRPVTVPTSGGTMTSG